MDVTAKVFLLGAPSERAGCEGSRGWQPPAAAPPASTAAFMLRWYFQGCSQPCKSVAKVLEPHPSCPTQESSSKSSLLWSSAWPTLSQSHASGHLGRFLHKPPSDPFFSQVSGLHHGTRLSPLTPAPSSWTDTQSYTGRDTKGKMLGNTFVL